ncbi:unnamed protein product [Polarella glacialis]|uniref:Uncharacterized protein n=1 Tax=Polarella glacialis TaxID=89957 RepID=A0A813JWB0_POLGL|nr:unnamed protein product [Polarella glacialis]
MRRRIWNIGPTSQTPANLQRKLWPRELLAFVGFAEERLHVEALSATWKDAVELQWRHYHGVREMPGDLTAAVGAMGRFQWWECRQPSCAFYRKALNTEGAVDALRVLSEPDLANPCIPFLYEVSKKSSGALPITPARMADVGKDTMQDACAIIGAHSLVASNSLFFKYLALLNENRPRVVLPVPSDSQAVEPFLGQDAWTAEFPEWSKRSLPLECHPSLRSSAGPLRALLCRA